MEFLRDQVISAFRPEDGYTYSHKLPFQYSNFIDGMAWVGMLCGAAHLAKDAVLIELTEGYLNNLILSGEDARNFGPTHEVSPDWEHSERMTGFSFKRKPQAFAGPSAIHWAIKCGARIANPPKIPTLTARALCAVALPFGYLISFIPALRQHLNSVMFAHFLLGKTPPGSLRFLANGNPVYSYLYGIPLSHVYLDNGPWPAKDWPGNARDRTGYTPTCSLVGQYLANSLKEN